jgi:hypothetical protein
MGVRCVEFVVCQTNIIINKVMELVGGLSIFY